MKRISLIIFLSVFFAALGGSVCYSQDKGYKTNNWDEIAKKVHFTVIQEKQLKDILTNERKEILNVRREAADKIYPLLDAKKKKDWDNLLSKAKKSRGEEAYEIRRKMTNLAYLEANFGLSPADGIKISQIINVYHNKIRKIRNKTFGKIGKVLIKDQIYQWEEYFHPIEYAELSDSGKSSLRRNQ